MKAAHVFRPEGPYPVFRFCGRIPSFDTGKGKEIEETTGIDGCITAVQQVNGRLSPPLRRIVLNVVVDKTCVVGKFHKRQKRQYGIVSTESFTDQQRKQGPPALAAPVKQIPARQNKVPNETGIKAEARELFLQPRPSGLPGKGPGKRLFYLFDTQGILLFHSYNNIMAPYEKLGFFLKNKKTPCAFLKTAYFSRKVLLIVG
jgi:hypothetical protein